VALESAPADLVVFGGTTVASHVPLVPRGVPCLFVIPGVDSLVYERQLAGSPAAVRFLLRDLLGDAGKLAAYERDVLGRADGVLAISAEEEKRIRAVAARPLPSLVLPPLFASRDALARARGDSSRTRLAFLGKFSWWPNREAIEWFLREVWPAVRRPQLELHLYGEGSEAFDDRGANVHGHGYQDDLDGIWRDSDVFINPMLSSTGVNVKVCEAIFQGLPVLTSPPGLRGLDFPPDPAVIACATPGDWIDQLRDESLGILRRRMPCESSRRYFELRERVPQLRAFVDAVTTPAECLQAASSA
jgi:glycosyltransferase involved in cell wall biosynthesis